MVRHEISLLSWFSILVRPQFNNVELSSFHHCKMYFTLKSLLHFPEHYNKKPFFSKLRICNKPLFSRMSHKTQYSIRSSHNLECMEAPWANLHRGGRADLWDPLFNILRGECRCEWARSGALDQICTVTSVVAPN